MIERTEKWTREGQVAWVDVQVYEVVEVAYALFADLLRQLGWEKCADECGGA